MDGLEKWRYMFRDTTERVAQWFAQAAVEHKIQLVVEEFRQIGADRSRQHPNTLKDGLF